MAAMKFVILLVSAVIISCESSLVDTHKKCGLHDRACLLDVLNTALDAMCDHGYPEIGIPVLDPLQIQNMNVAIENLVNITLVDGIVKGIKGCIAEDYNVNIESGHSSLSMKCPKITIKGHYQVFSQGDVIEKFLGTSKGVNGDGKGKLQIDNLKLGLDFYHSVVKRGEKYFIEIKNIDKTKYTYDMDKITFNANNLKIGDVDASATIIKAMNDNWKSMIGTAGNPIMGVAKNITVDYVIKYFSEESIDHYISDDMSSYVVS